MVIRARLSAIYRRNPVTPHGHGNTTRLTAPETAHGFFRYRGVKFLTTVREECCSDIDSSKPLSEFVHWRVFGKQKLTWTQSIPVRRSCHEEVLERIVRKLAEQSLRLLVEDR